MKGGEPSPAAQAPSEGGEARGPIESREPCHGAREARVKFLVLGAALRVPQKSIQLSCVLLRQCGLSQYSIRDAGSCRPQTKAMTGTYFNAHPVHLDASVNGLAVVYSKYDLSSRADLGFRPCLSLRR